MGILLDLLLKALAVEAISEIVTKSTLFSPLQHWARAKDTWMKRLFSCAYCLSVWVSFVVCFFFTTFSLPLLLEIFIVHRLSNYLHHAYEICFWKCFSIKEKYDK